MNTVTEVAKLIRAELKTAGIKARCRVAPGATDSIQVFVPKFDARFAEDEQRAIRTMAVGHGLTWVRGLPIDVDRMTDPSEMTFYL